MSTILDEKVFRMPPVSMGIIERLGTHLLAELCPEALDRPIPVDILRLVEQELPKRGIHVSPATAAELGAREAATDPSGSGEIEILIVEDQWHQLLGGGPRSHRPRATIAHELSHAVLHVPIIRGRRAAANGELLLNRVSRNELPAYMDPEWQAWALAGCILAPRVTVEQLLQAGFKLVSRWSKWPMSIR